MYARAHVYGYFVINPKIKDMQSIVNKANAKSVKDFPKLMIDPDGIIILAKLITSTGCLEGINLTSNSQMTSIDHRSYSKAWSDCFKDFEGSVTLSNE